MSDTVGGESTFENRRGLRVRIALVVDHDACPADTIPRIGYYSGGVEL